MDLIEVLWKQDVDLGFSLEQPATNPDKETALKADAATSITEDDDIEKLKALKALNDEIADVSSYECHSRYIDV